MDAARLEARTVCELAQDQERPRSRQSAAPRVQEELGPVATIEVRATEGEVSPDGLGGWTPERHEPLLPALAQHADDALLERHAVLLESDRLRDTQAGAVEKLDECAVAQRAWRGTVRCVDETLGLRRRQSAG